MTQAMAPRPVTPLGILTGHLAELKTRAAALDYADQAFVDTLEAAATLAAGLDPYLSANTSAPSDALVELAQATARENWGARFEGGETQVSLEQEMLSGHVEGQCLKMLVAATGARRVLEVGLFTGYSALAMAEALPTDGELVACEIDDYAADFAQGFFARSPHGDKIRIQRGPAGASLKTLAQAGVVFGLVFIDADKASYIDYLTQILDSSLLALNGLICVDNTLMQGQAYDAGERTANGDAIAGFNQTVAHDNCLQKILLPLRDGLTLIRRAHD